MKDNKSPMGQLLLQAFRWFDQSLRQSLAHRGWPEITPSQSMLMAHVKSDGIRISDLARCLDISRQAAQRLVHELHQKGLVTMEDDPSNLSAKLVALSLDGEEIVKEALRIFQNLEHYLGEQIGDNKVNALRLALESNWGSPITVETNNK